MLMSSPVPAMGAAQSPAAAAAHLCLPDFSLHSLLAPGSAWLLKSIIYKAARHASVDMDVSSSSRPKVKLPQGPIWQPQDGHVVADLQCMQPSDRYLARWVGGTAPGASACKVCGQLLGTAHPCILAQGLHRCEERPPKLLEGTQRHPDFSPWC